MIFLKTAAKQLAQPVVSAIILILHKKKKSMLKHFMS
jgi:hypothetical protein